MKVLGLISGTSHDGIDCAVVNFKLRDDGGLDAVLEHVDSVPYSLELRSQLISALPPAKVDLRGVTVLDTRIGQELAAAASVAASGRQVDAICSHGQTVYHWVQEGAVHGTLQLGQPAWIAERTGIPVIADLRSRDIAAGGQGAPLVPILDTLLLATEEGPSVALNLGGISNATILRPGSEPVAYDIGPANALIDAAVRMTGAHPGGYDEDGRIAAAGTVHEALLQELLAEPYYAAPAPKSTGKELFNEAYIYEFLKRSETLADKDLIATLTELTVRTVADELRRTGVTTVVVSGGGAANPTIMEGLRLSLPDARITTSDEYGIPSDVKEAVAFALIGWLSLHGLPGTVATATGAHTARILGTVLPGGGPLQLPSSLSTLPTALRIHPPQSNDDDVVIRPADLSDQEGIAEVFFDCWSSSYREVLPAELIDRMDREGAQALWAKSLTDTSAETRVAVLGETVVGVVGFGIDDNESGHVRSLYVSPKTQGGGYGRRLLENATVEMKEKGVKEITLWVFEENIPSRRFYEQQGWTPDGERTVDPNYGEPQIRLTRRLP